MKADNSTTVEADDVSTELDSRTTDASTYVNDEDLVFNSFCRNVKTTLSYIFTQHPASVVDYLYLSMLYVSKNWNDCRVVENSREHKKLCKELEFILSELKYNDAHLMGIAICISCPRVEEAMQVLKAPIAIQIQFKCAEVICNYQFVKDTNGWFYKYKSIIHYWQLATAVLRLVF